jgi:serine/threonine protein kinase
MAINAAKRAAGALLNFSRAPSLTSPCPIAEGVSAFGITIGERIGHGGEKDVSKGLKGKKPVAILLNRLPPNELSFVEKILNKFKNESLPTLHNVTHPLLQTERHVAREEEISTLLEDCPHVINPSLIPPFTTPKGVVRVIELLDGDLLDVGTGSTTFVDIIRWFRDAAKGLTCMHAAGLVHMDFKPENVFTRGKVGVLADLGFVKEIESKLYTPVGTPAYMDPKMMSSLIARPENDIYSFGISLDDITSELALYPDGEYDPMKQLYCYIKKHLICKDDRRDAYRIVEDLDLFLSQIDKTHFPSLGKVALEKIVRKKANNRVEFGFKASN